jgi:hypothetical protein
MISVLIFVFCNWAADVAVSAGDFKHSPFNIRNVRSGICREGAKGQNDVGMRSTLSAEGSFLQEQTEGTEGFSASWPHF